MITAVGVFGCGMAVGVKVRFFVLLPGLPKLLMKLCEGMDHTRVSLQNVSSRGHISCVVPRVLQVIVLKPFIIAWLVGQTMIDLFLTCSLH